ncbi:MAG: Glu/Leu/Phe/Val dehydrogenase dimerization domain-containing protein, partial [Dehalococcoidia bacterium]
MKILKYMEKYGYEQLVLCTDKDAGLKAIISIHDTTLGPACGGARMWPFASEEEAILDA